MLSGYVGDLVSFTRLMNLGLSGASIGSAFNLIVSLFPPLGRFTVGLLLFIVLKPLICSPSCQDMCMEPV